MSFSDIDEKALDLDGNTLRLWNDPSVGIFRPVVVWHHAVYGEMTFECETDEHAEQLFRLLQQVRAFSAEFVSGEVIVHPSLEGSGIDWQDPIEEAARDLAAKGFVDVTREEGKCPGGDDAYVFRGPDGVLYHCSTQLQVLSVLAEREIVVGMISSGSGDTHFFRGADGAYHCLVRVRGKEVLK